MQPPPWTAIFKYEFGGEGGIRTHDTLAGITVFELAGAVRQYPNVAALYCGNASEVMARAGWRRVVSARSARAVHTSVGQVPLERRQCEARAACG